jgi:hypothetical protein
VPCDRGTRCQSRTLLQLLTGLYIINTFNGRHAGHIRCGPGRLSRHIAGYPVPWAGHGLTVIRSLQRIRKARRQKLAPTELSALRVSWHDSWACQRTFPCRWIRCAAEQDACNAAKCKRSIRFAFDARCIPEATERRLAAPWARRGHRSDLVYGVQSATDAKRLPIPAREIDLRTLPYRAASPGWLKSRRGRAFHPQPQSYWLSGHAKSASGR